MKPGKSFGRNKIQPRYEKGESGNPGGQPKGKRISTWMMELGQMSSTELDKIRPTLPVNGLIAYARVIKAMDFDHGEQSTEIILERTEGKVLQPVSVENKDPIPHKTAEEAAQAILNIGKQK